MSSIIENLRLFNSKERYFLVDYALEGGFKLSGKFCKDVNKGLKLDMPESPLFAAMDYHLDWILASLKLAKEPDSLIFPNSSKGIEATQEDIDLIIAFDKGEETHIVLLEVKGVTGWTNKQLDSKAVRFAKIFGEDGKLWAGVVPHFAIVSPRKPTGLVIKEWPAWMKFEGEFAWIELPGTGGHFRVHRCNKAGKQSIEGDHWTIIERRKQ